jgi:hypothetical protein
LLTIFEQQDQDAPPWYCSKAVYSLLWHIPMLCVQWKTPDDGHRNCLEHVEFHSKIKFEKIRASSWFCYKEKLEASWLRTLRKTCSPYNQNILSFFNKFNIIFFPYIKS